MNPSAQGWIDKYGALCKKHAWHGQEEMLFYNALKKAGFIYGINVEVVLKWLGEEQLSDDEIAKLNLLSALHNAVSATLKRMEDLRSLYFPFLNFMVSLPQ